MEFRTIDVSKDKIFVLDAEERRLPDSSQKPQETSITSRVYLNPAAAALIVSISGLTLPLLPCLLFLCLS